MTKSKIYEKIYNEKDLKVDDFKCENCGGETIFDVKEQKLKCLYCGSLFEVKNDKFAQERELQELLSKGEVWKEAEVFQCQSCGAKEIIQAGEVSLICPFCGTNSIVKIDEIPGLKPQGIAPFKITKKQASLLAIKWAKKKLYAPNKFKKSVKAENLHGFYNPVFTFDANAISNYHGQLGKNYVVTSYHNGKPITVTKVRYFTISGENKAFFDDVLIQASSDIKADILKKLEPFPTRQVLEYKPEYLRGYSACTYDKEGGACWAECKQNMDRIIESQILNRYDYDVKVALNVKTKFFGEKYKYILVPVYAGNYKYKNKLYNFFVNGDNGKIAGKTPIAKWKVFVTIFVILAVIVGLFFICK